ncbi:hypothetical protein [Leuconostoc mesenteroides]|uniref:hypothetical protein n=1 Tax=Leuconostoc mesenteroides TaxID=1245 RepID=UPI00236210F7|nr:hypothetical protein [Leuconostoc mesenteroides]
MIMKLKQADLLFVKNGHSDSDEGIAESTGNFVHVAILADEKMSFMQQLIQAFVYNRFSFF